MNIIVLLSIIQIIACLGIDFKVEDFSNEGDALSALSSDTVYDCEAEDVSNAMKLSWWEVTSELINICRDGNVDVTSSFYQSANTIRTQLKELTNLMRIKKGEKRVISPAFEWTQSSDAIHINVKLSHKIDAPATLGCTLTQDSVKMTNSSLKLIAPCPIHHKTFELNLDLFDSIDPDDSLWSEASVGRVTFEIRKKNNDKLWSRLLKDEKKIWNMHTWLSMKDQLKEEARLQKEAAEEREKEEKKKEEELNKNKSDPETPTTATASTSTETDVKVEEKLPPKKNGNISAVNKICKSKTRDLDSKKESLIRDIEKVANEEKHKIDAEAKKNKQNIDERLIRQREEIKKQRDDANRQLKKACVTEARAAEAVEEFLDYKPREEIFNKIIEDFIVTTANTNIEEVKEVTEPSPLKEEL